MYCVCQFLNFQLGLVLVRRAVEYTSGIFQKDPFPNGGRGRSLTTTTRLDVDYGKAIISEHLGPMMIHEGAAATKTLLKRRKNKTFPAPLLCRRFGQEN